MIGPLCILEGRNKSYMKVLDVNISKFLVSKILCLRGSVGRAVDFRSRGPGFDSRPSFLKVWAKKFLPWEDFNSWFS